MHNVTKYNLERYNDKADFDKYSEWKHHKLRIKIMVDLVEYAFSKSNKNIQDFKILDIGGNTGVISKKLLDKGFDVTVADLSEEALRICKSKQIKTIKFDFNEVFPIANNSFDLLIVGEVIEHILDVELFLNECNRILKINGYIDISTPNLANFKDRIGFLFGKMPRQINPHHEYLKLHIRHFNYAALKNSLEIAGFNLVKFRSNYFTLKRINGKPLFIRFLAVLFPKLSSSLIVLARKNSYNTAIGVNGGTKIII